MQLSQADPEATPTPKNIFGDDNNNKFKILSLMLKKNENLGISKKNKYIFEGSSLKNLKIRFSSKFFSMIWDSEIFSL